MRTLTALMLALALAGPPQSPKPQPAITGVWMLKSATIGGKAATSKEMSGLLTGLGGVETGMVWRFRKPTEEGEGGCDLNGVDAGYEIVPETRELILDAESKDGEFKQILDLRLTDKNMRLRYRKGGKTVELLMVRED